MIAELPFSNVPSRRFSTLLGDAEYTFETRFNDRSGVWTFDLYDGTSQQLMVASVPMVLGQDLLEPYNFGIGSILCVDANGTGIDAGPNDLGDRVKVYWFSADEVIA